MKNLTLSLFAALVALVVSRPALTQEAATLSDLQRREINEVYILHVHTQKMIHQILIYSKLCFQEYETSRYVTCILEKNGFRVELGVAEMPTAWVASYGSGKPVIAFITDIDCIPKASQKPGVAYH